MSATAIAPDLDLAGNPNPTVEDFAGLMNAQTYEAKIPREAVELLRGLGFAIASQTHLTAQVVEEPGRPARLVVTIRRDAGTTALAVAAAELSASMQELRKYVNCIEGLVYLTWAERARAEGCGEIEKKAAEVFGSGWEGQRDKAKVVDEWSPDRWHLAPWWLMRSLTGLKQKVPNHIAEQDFFLGLYDNRTKNGCTKASIQRAIGNRKGALDATLAAETAKKRNRAKLRTDALTTQIDAMHANCKVDADTLADRFLAPLAALRVTQELNPAMPLDEREVIACFRQPLSKRSKS